MSRRRDIAIVAAAALVPRLLVVALERADILAAFTEKSDEFAQTVVASGTFGLIPGVPSAYTQPLYAFFLVPLYAVDRHWLLVGGAQAFVACGTALVVYAIGARWMSPRAGLAAALVATLNPYLIWHDVHVNREVLDTLAAALLVLAALAAAARPSLWRGALAGVVAGLAVLGNTRLALLPLLVAGFVLWRVGARRAWPVAVALLAAAVIVVGPWLVRNEVQVGCVAITTDARALWKANNDRTYGILAGGGWIDDVPSLPGRELTPEVAGAIYRDRGEIVRVDECADMRFYQDLVVDFWQEHPGAKAKLAAQATWMLWDPRVSPQSENSPGAGTWRDTARVWLTPLYTLPLFGFALLGLRLLPRDLLVLVLGLLVYVTLTAMVFAGATRYRAPWDFLLALAAAPAILAVLDRRVSRR